MTGPGVETEADFGAPPDGDAARWVAEIEAFERECAAWWERADKILARYREEGRKPDGAAWFSILWANVEVLKPTLYARDPQPRVFRRFRDRDPVARVAALLLERALACQIERGGDFHEAARAAVLDNLLSAQGQAWVFYEPEFDAAGAVSAEHVRLGHVGWREFGRTAGARSWAEVTAVWRVAYMTRAELAERFGEAGRAAPLDRKAPRRDGGGEGRDARDVFGKATVYEIWDSARREVVWVHKALPAPLDARPYPLGLRGRFPCPCPLYGTRTTGSLVPIPDYVFYQGQARQLDRLTARIDALTSALRMVGFVAGDAAPDVQKALDSRAEVALSPVAAAAMSGGAPLANAIAWLPVREVAETLLRLIDAREQVKRDAYEITGLSDILRGQTRASETATAQQIKAQWGSVRVRERQQDVARWCRECVEIMADVVAGHFSPETIAALANADALPPDQQQHVPAALALLSGPGALRAYRVDVETDSTLAPDEQAERQAATELLTGVGGYLAQALPVLGGVQQAAPAALGPMAELVGGLLSQAVRRFRGGDEVEELVERAMQALAQSPPPAPGGAAPPPPPPPPDPAAEAKALADARRVEIEAAKAQASAAGAVEELALRREELALRREVAEFDAALRTEELALRRAELDLRAAGAAGPAPAPAPAGAAE